MDNYFPAYQEFLRKTPDERKVLRLIEDPQAMAYAWIEGYAENLTAQVEGYYHDYADDDYSYNDPVTVHNLIETGMSQLGDGYGDYISRGGAFEGERVEPMFWDKLAILLGTEIPTDNRNSFFSCFC